MYFIINNGEGDTTVEEVTEQELLKRITPCKDGYSYYGEKGFMTQVMLKENSDTNYWGENLLIIKGEIVVPKVKEVVKTYEL